MTKSAPLDQTTEERALAQRLARVGPHGEPSPQLDARVLAAARAALDAQPRPTHRSRRWPVALGVAASLVLAVGVAWRLRPLPPGSTSEFTRSVPPIAPAPVSTPAAAAPARQVVSGAARDAGIEMEPPAAPVAAPRRTAKIAAPAPAPDVESDAAPVILDAPAPPPPPTPASAPALAPQQDATTSGAAQTAPAAASGANAAGELDRAATSQAQSEAGDEPLDAMPPATADAPGVRDAWLSRIRALIDSGDVAGGRRSLRAFADRYPDYPLPEDLRALLR